MSRLMHLYFRYKNYCLISLVIFFLFCLQIYFKSPDLDQLCSRAKNTKYLTSHLKCLVLISPLQNYDKVQTISNSLRANITKNLPPSNKINSKPAEKSIFIPPIFEYPDLDLPWWERSHMKRCNESDEHILPKNLNVTFFNEVKGHCGYRAWKLGPRQKVLSLTLYGSKKVYWKGLSNILDSMRILYPGWVSRLYVNPRGRYDYICPIMVNYPELYLCDIKRLPDSIGDLTRLDPMLWRSAPMGDFQVERFIVRDTDSQMLDRERAAVIEWEAEPDKLFHVMRDHPFHTAFVMGGMFGVYQPDPDTKKYFDKIRHKLFNTINFFFNNDQDRLRMALPQELLTKNRILQHTSHPCKRFRNTRPFPTQRVNGTYVGSPDFRELGGLITEICPEECRPSDHKDWIYC